MWHDAIKFLPQLLSGVKYTIGIALVVMVLATILGLAVALGRLSKFAAVRWPLIAYVELIRGTPALVQLYYIFYVLPTVGLTLPALMAGIVGLTLCYAAYLSEVFRSAIQAVPTVQRDAAGILGLNWWQITRLVVLPQATKIALPPTVNYLLSLFKDTSLLSLITIQELMFRGYILGSITFKYTLIFSEVAILYFIVCYPWAWLAGVLERRLNTQGTTPLKEKKRRVARLAPLGGLR